MSSPTADVSVRVAWADDAPAIAELQLRTWRATYADLVPVDALPTDVEAAAASWRAALARPGDARNRVLVALERNRVVGFAITSPASDPDCDQVADAELAELTVDPDERGKGHGPREPVGLHGLDGRTASSTSTARAPSWSSRSGC